ncbi:MAG: rod shape-determining protein RodA [Candidatus Omnitrophica bacterium]|nr:rod shape-determining protein RodA [Candidatus Omnitrophota bacterium]MDD5573774.1 rod shape-determining protein RodA [Candidatus Omnitrophota bacterium]
MMTARPRKVITIVIFILLFFGLLCLYSSCHQKGIFVKKDIFVKQLLWVGVGWGVLFLASRYDYRSLKTWVIPLYVVSLLCLFYVLFSGRAIMGAQRWISLGEFSFQPSELGKFALILTLAAYYSIKASYDLQARPRALGAGRGILLPLLITLVPTGMVLLQPDLGTAIVYLFIFASVALLAEVRMRYLLSLAAAGLALMPLFWHFLKDYQKSRLMVFLNPNTDPLGAGYTIIQSKIAIGSGRFFGKGWMSGTQSQLNFLAERHTDFIFSVWGEEWGFFGSFVLVVLYALLIVSILRVAELARDMFGRLLAAGVAALVFFHAFINIAMNIGMCPVVGLPLPFMSYGGSSLVINMAAIGIVLNIARQK